MNYQSVNTNKMIPFLTFRPHPTQIRPYLAEKGCFSKRNQAVYRELLDLTDLNETQRIHDVLDCYSGITFYTSRRRIADRSGYSLRSVSYALAELRHAKAIKQLDKHPETGCYRYKLFVYDDAIEYLKANPDHPRCRVTTLEPLLEQMMETCAKKMMDLLDRFENLKPLESAQNEGVQTLQAGGAVTAPNKDKKKEKKDYPAAPTSLDGELLAGDPETPAQQHESVDLDTGVKQDAPERVKGEKNSLRAKEGQALFPSAGFSLADWFAGEAAEYVDSGLRKERAGQIEVTLWNMFHDPTVAETYPDPTRHAEACVEVVKVWIAVVRQLEYPPDQIGFIKTKRGRKILADAKAKVFGNEKIRQKWANGEAGTPRQNHQFIPEQNTPPRQSIDEAIAYTNDPWIKDVLKRVKKAGEKTKSVDREMFEAERLAKQRR